MKTMAVDDLIEAEETRIKSLERLKELLAQAEKIDVDRNLFRKLFVVAIRVLELDQVATSRITKASRPTVSRWISGHAAPHRVGRSSVFRELRKVAGDKLRQHSSTPRKRRKANRRSGSPRPKP